jgi:hypothetical protein
MDEMRLHTAVQRALRTERKQKFEVATKIGKGKILAFVMCINAAGCHRVNSSLLSKGKNKECHLEHAFPLVLTLL